MRNFISLLSLIFCLTACLIFGITCGQSKKINGNVPFDLTRPDSIIVLPDVLHEISGMTWYNSLILAIQDEAGVIYRIDPQRGLLNNKGQAFTGKGDFEAIEALDSMIYILTSEGELFVISLSSTQDVINQTVVNTLPYRKKENFEGMTIHKGSGLLFIVAKETPENAKKHMYPIDPDHPEQSQDPVYTFNIDTLQAYLDAGRRQSTRRLAEWLTGEEYTFNPSAIAIDPLSDRYYVLSYPGQQLLILSPEFNIEALMYLDPSYFQQPEGICFDDSGNLYISNEARSGNSNILIFIRKKDE